MKAALVFDSVNDLVFGKWDSTFIESMKTFSVQASIPFAFNFTLHSHNNMMLVSGYQQ